MHRLAQTFVGSQSLPVCLMLFFSLALSACSSDGDNTSSTPSIPIETTISASIGNEGGSISATSTEGVSYTLVIPVGALTETVNIQLTPLANMGASPLNRGLVGAVTMEPSGLVFARAVTLHIDAVATPETDEILAGFILANDGSALGLRPPVVVDGGIEISFSHFSTAGSATLTAEEIEELPDEALETPGDHFMNELMRKPSVGNGDTEQLGIDISDGFRQWYLEHVKPLLNEAITNLGLNPSTVNDLLDDPAIEAYREWIRARVAIEVLTDGSTNANSLLADLDAEAKPLVAQLIIDRIDLSIAQCPIQASLRLLSFAALYQNIAVELVLASEDFSLDSATFLSKVNSCARPVLDEIDLPSPLNIGTPSSLDAVAKVVFNGTPDPEDAPFEFTIIPTGASVQNAIGKSDAGGRYTTVFTPSADEVEFLVRACLVLEFFDANNGSDICASQTVSSVIEEEGSAAASLTQAQITSYAGPMLRDNCDPVGEEQTAQLPSDAGPNFPPLSAEVEWIGSAFINRTASAIAQTSASVDTNDNGSLHSMSASMTATITTDVPDTRTPSCEIRGEGNAEFLFSISGGSMSYLVIESPTSPADHGSDNASSALFLLGSSPTLLYGLDSSGTLQGSATGILEPGNYRYVLDAFYANNANVFGSGSGTSSNSGTLTLTPVAPTP